MYDHSDGCKRLRMFNFVTLAYWHSFKFVSQQLWKVFANDVWAPLWHTLYPGHAFYKTNKSLPMVVAHFIYVEVAFDGQNQEKLDRLLTNVSILKPQAANMLHDLNFLIRIAIPVVLSTPLLFVILKRILGH